MKGKSKEFFKRITNTHFRLINWIYIFLILHQNIAKSSHVFLQTYKRNAQRKKKSEST